jgi:hypothetical protein
VFAGFVENFVAVVVAENYVTMENYLQMFAGAGNGVGDNLI